LLGNFKEIYNIHGQYDSGDQTEKNEMGAASSRYGSEERRIKGFGGETCGKETTWKTQA